MTRTITHDLLLLCLALAVPIACGGETKKQDARAAKADSKPASKAETKPTADVEKAAEKAAEDAAPERSMDTPEGRVALAAMVASEIAEAPDKADEILEKNGLDRDKLDDLMYEIARDPALSKAYKDLRMAG